jgi:peptide/nickel transport system substrate-binding protein
MKRREFQKMLLGTAAAGIATRIGLMGDGAVYAQTSGGGLVSIVQPEPPLLNLALNQQLPTGMVAGKIYESLLDFDFDLSPKPQLAESWERSEDGLTYTFHLVKNAKWHDGTPFTAADVVFSCAVMLPEVHPRARTNFARCESITAPDDHTVVFRLRQPFGPFLLSFETSSCPIVPKHIYEGSDYRNNPANDLPIGTGPFRFNEWVRGAHIHLLANEDYYREGLPHLTEIWYRVMPDAASRAAALETGEVQIAQFGDVETFDVARLAALPTLEMTTKGYEFYSPVLWYELNLRKAPFSDLRFRKAMMHLLDRQFIVDRIMFGLAAPASGPIASTTKYYSPDVNAYPLDIAAANAFLDEMGLMPDANGTRVTIQFLVAPYAETWIRLAEYFREAMKAGGIEVVLNSTDVAGWGKSVGNWEYEVTVNMLYQFGDPAFGVSRSYISSNIRQGVLFSNTQGYSNPEVDRLFEAAAAATDEEARQALYTEVQKLLVDELPVLWMTEQRYPTIYDNRLQDLIVSAIGVNGNYARARYA